MVRKEASALLLVGRGPSAGSCPRSSGFPWRRGCARWLGRMVRLQLDQRQWQKIEAVLGEKKAAGRPGRDDRNFVEAVPWWRRTGAPWRDLPSDFGPWKTVFNRFDRGASKGIWQRLFEA